MANAVRYRTKDDLIDGMVARLQRWVNANRGKLRPWGKDGAEVPITYTSTAAKLGVAYPTMASWFRRGEGRRRPTGQNTLDKMAALLKAERA